MLSELPQFLEDVQIAHNAYLSREALAERTRRDDLADVGALLRGVVEQSGLTQRALVGVGLGAVR